MMISVIIPARNEAEHIASCIRSIARNASDEIELEILVVDGCSTDGTLRVVEALSRDGFAVGVIRNPEMTTPVAMNLGLAQSRGSYIMFSGAHAEYPPDYIRTCLDCFRRNPDAWCVGGYIDTVSTTMMGRLISAAMSSPFGVGNARFRLGAYDGKVDTLTFGLYPRWVFDRIGGFDENLIRNQDDDLNFRIIEASGSLYMDSRISSKYYSRTSLPKLYRQYYQYGYWRLKTLLKHRGVASLRHLVPPLFVFYLMLVIVSAALWGFGAAACFFAPYIIVLLAGTVDVFRRSKMLASVLAPVILATLHTSYGLGFWRCVWDWLRGNGASTASKQITR